MTAIAATSYTSRILVDGTLAMTIHIDPPFRDAAIALFGAPGSEMALAALQTARAEPAKGGPLAKWVAIRCGEPAFQQWAKATHLTQWDAAPGDTPKAWAASVVRAVCSIKSRAELDNDPAAAERFHTRIRKPYEACQ